MTNRVIGGVISILIGLCCAIFHKSLGASAADQQQIFWGLFRFRTYFSEKSIKGMQIMFLIFGISSIIFGLLLLCQIIRSR